MHMQRLEGLAARRKAAGYTQQSFADELGVQRAALAAWETLRAYPSAGLLPAIADMLLCSIDELYKAPEEVRIATATEPPRNDSEEVRADVGIGPYEGDREALRAAEGVGPYEGIIADQEGDDHAE